MGSYIKVNEHIYARAKSEHQPCKKLVLVNCLKDIIAYYPLVHAVLSVIRLSTYVLAPCTLSLG